MYVNIFCMSVMCVFWTRNRFESSTTTKIIITKETLWRTHIYSLAVIAPSHRAQHEQKRPARARREREGENGVFLLPHILFSWTIPIDIPLFLVFSPLLLLLLLLVGVFCRHNVRWLELPASLFLLTIYLSLSLDLSIYQSREARSKRTNKTSLFMLLVVLIHWVVINDLSRGWVVGSLLMRTIADRMTCSLVRSWEEHENIMLRDIHPFKSLTSRIAANAKQTVSKSSSGNRVTQEISRDSSQGKNLSNLGWNSSRISIERFRTVAMNSANDSI